MAYAMAQSQREVAAVTLSDDVDIHDWQTGTDITYRIIRALLAGCRAVPDLNAHFDMNKLERILYPDVHLGIAMDLPDGLFVPVLRNVQSLSPAEIRQGINIFKEQIKNRSISPEQLKGSTIQLSNFGTFAGRYANPIIVPPIVAILGTGKIRQQVIPVAGAPAVRRVLPLSLTIDHRAVTGGEAARFLATVMENLSKGE
jgi:pyruvate dehydrogenase E2 component (dihydrolipoamide acetyltransferase)